MGWETVLFAAFTGLKAVTQMNAAEKQAQQTVKQGEIDAQQRATRVNYNASQQTASFLASGLTLEGTPMDVVNETFKTGKQDVDNIRQGADAKAKNQIATGRSQVINDIVGSFVGSSLMSGSAGAMFESGVGNLTNDLGLNGVGQDVGSWFSKSSMGPYKPFGI